MARVTTNCSEKHVTGMENIFEFRVSVIEEGHINYSS